VVEHLHSKCEAISSNSSTIKDKRKKKLRCISVILATLEAELKRIMIQGQPQQKV
jgi:hypothetical protein